MSNLTLNFVLRIGPGLQVLLVKGKLDVIRIFGELKSNVLNDVEILSRNLNEVKVFKSCLTVARLRLN